MDTHFLVKKKFFVSFLFKIKFKNNKVVFVFIVKIIFILKICEFGEKNSFLPNDQFIKLHICLMANSLRICQKISIFITSINSNI